MGNPLGAKGLMVSSRLKEIIIAFIMVISITLFSATSNVIVWLRGLALAGLQQRIQEWAEDQ